MSAHAEDSLIGWRKLPDELKVQVLEYVLPSGFTLSSHVFVNQPRLKSDKYPNFREDILPVLACPEIATLGIEVLYKQNACLLINLRSVFQKVPYWPPNLVRKFVRSWRAYIQLKDLYSTAFRTAIRSLQDSLTAIDITLHIFSSTILVPPTRTTSTIATLRQNMMVMKPLEFPTNKLTMDYKVDGLIRSHPLGDLTDVLQKLLTISGEGKGVKQKCERRVITYGKEAKDTTRTVVATRPELTEWKQSREVWMTVWRWKTGATQGWTYLDMTTGGNKCWFRDTMRRYDS